LVEPSALLVHAVLALGAGLLIGCVGIGGVILVPGLVYLAGYSFRTAIAAAMVAFIASGIVGLYAYARAGSIPIRAAAWVSLGALPCAYLGALGVAAASPVLLELAIALLAAGSGALALLKPRARRASRDVKTLARPLLAVVGGVTGFLSALTGTGGPLILVPILLSVELPPLVALGLAQAIQLPVAVAATLGNLVTGALDVPLGLVLAAGIALGTWTGAKAAHALPTDALRSAVAGVLVVVGASMLVRSAAF
jgi:uncharacterized membrane protein YfcA